MIPGGQSIYLSIYLEVLLFYILASHNKLYILSLLGRTRMRILLKPKRVIYFRNVL